MKDLIAKCIIVLFLIIVPIFIINDYSLAADRGYNHNYSGEGGKIVTIDITSGNKNNSDSETGSSNNNSTTSSQEAQSSSNASSSGQTVPLQQNSDSQNSSNNSGVSIGSSTSSPTSTETPNSNEPASASPDNSQPESQNNSTTPDESNIRLLDFYNSMATLKVKADETMNENLILKSNKLLLGFSLQRQIDGDSDYFELYFTDESNNKIDVSEKRFIVDIKINPEREFLGFYEVIDDSSLKVLNYNKTSDSVIQFETTGLNKYVICYKTEEIQDNTLNSNQVENNMSQDIPVSMNQDNNNNYLWMVLGITLCAVILFAIIAIIVFKKFIL